MVNIEGGTLSLYTTELRRSPGGKAGRLSPEAVLGRLGQLSSPVRHLRTPSPIRHLQTPIILTMSNDTMKQEHADVVRLMKFVA